MTKAKQKTREAKRTERAKIAQKMALIAFEELNLNQDGSIKLDENGEPCKIGTVSGLAFKTGLLAVIKKVTSMQLNIYKLLLKGFPGVSNVLLEYPTLTFSYCPIQSNSTSQTEASKQSTIQIVVEDLIHGLKPTESE